jgi:hypothetical protein
MRLRSLVTAAAVTALPLMLGGVAASASPTVPAAPPRTAPVTRAVQAAPADPYEFGNVNGLRIVGDTHGENLIGRNDVSHGTPYVQYSKGHGWYTYSANNLCWNTLGGSGDPIGMDSCPSGDTNEWFATPPVDGGAYVYLKNWHGLCIWGAGNGKTLFLKACSPTNNRDLWLKGKVPSAARW